MVDTLEAAYRMRLPLLTSLAQNLEHETSEALAGVPHVDRISFRVKMVESFLAKATDPRNAPPYTEPLIEVEDQVAGRIIVFFLGDIEVVRKKLSRTFTTVERSRRRPAKDEEFGYESEHLICVIPPQVMPSGWSTRSDMPRTIEIQLRTLFMHAYAEPQHDIGYKAVTELPSQVRRELAWIAASAWGADQACQRIYEWHAAKREKCGSTNQ